MIICPIMALACNSGHPDKQPWVDSWYCAGGNCAWFVDDKCAIAVIASKNIKQDGNGNFSDGNKMPVLQQNS